MICKPYIIVLTHWHYRNLQEELDEVFNQLSENQKTAEQPGRLTPSWPPKNHRNDVGDPYTARNGHYLANGFGSRFDDVILELQVPEQIVCKACHEITGQCGIRKLN